jgi:RNA polymerase sigma-70 factor (ECF subfamily)
MRSPSFDVRLAAARPAVRAFAGRLLGHTPFAQEIDDVVQETLTRALKSAHSHDESRALEPWLSGICVRVAADRVAARRRAASDVSDVPEPAVRGDHVAVDARDELERRLRVLGAREREVLLLFHRDGWSVARIAEHLAAPAGTIKSLLSRARRALAEHAAEHAAEHEDGEA